MPAVTVRNLPADVHAALKQRAAQHGRSTEAEIRLILEQAVTEPSGMSIAEEFAAIGREFNITDEFENLRDKTPMRIISFE